MRLDAGAESLACEYCGNIVFPEKNDDGVRVLGQPTSELCPTCGTGLVDASFSAAPLRYCTRCRGMLIDMDIFADLVQTLRRGNDGGGVIPQPPDRSELQRRLTCPHCRQAMETHFYAGPGNVIPLRLRTLLPRLARPRQAYAHRPRPRRAAGRGGSLAPGGSTP
jgi:Zn-finger nucleic acid-binding protein